MISHYLQKMNPITVRIHDGTKGQIVTQLLDMCLSSNSTAADLYKVIDGTLARLLDCEILGTCVLLLALTTLL